MFTAPVILDTNVFVGAGFKADSASRRIVDAVAAGDLLLVWNEATRAETLAVVGKIPPLRDFEVAPLFTDEGRYAQPTAPEAFALVEDPTDRKFAALAAAAGVVLVTSDDHLLGPRDQMQAMIVTPSEFVARSGVFG